jgi:hypothetical protein
LQHSDERPPTSGRPSLLSTEQQAEADRNRILGGLDGKSGAAPGAVRSKRRYSWLAAGLAAVVAIGAGSAVWLSGEGEKEIVLASSAPLPAAPAAAAPLVSEPPPANPEADDVSTAAILQDVPPAPAKPAAEDSKGAKDELTSLLERPSSEAAPVLPPAAVAKPVKPAPVKAAAKPAPKKVVLAKATPKKESKKEVKKDAKKDGKSASKTALAAAPANKKTEKKTEKKAETPAKAVDTDVTLLAALVAHSKATQPKKTVTPGEKLRQCKTLASVEAADQCRARLCASSAKNEAACKAPSLARSSSE